MKRFLITAALIVVALGIGLWLGTRRRGSTAYETERASLDLQFARTMLPFKVAFRVSLGLAILVLLGGLGWGGVRWLHRRANTVYPDRSGLYPIREERFGRAKVFHDPNRTLGGSTVYASGVQDLDVHHAIPEGHEDAQRQITGQAQAAQALRAAASGAFPLPEKQNLPIGMLDERSLARPLPEVKALPWEPSHIERLLLKDGNVND
jgi:hypothetical protein